MSLDALGSLSSRLDSAFGLLMKSCKCLRESISIDWAIYRAPWWQDCSTLGSEAPERSSDVT